MSDIKLDVTKLMDSSKVKVEKVVRRLTLSLFSRCIMMSPVDTGRFRANWQLSIGTPAYTEVDAFDKGPVTQDGSGASKTKEAVKQRVMTDKEAFGGKVYLINSLPYAGFLEYGSSQQAPYGMVRVSARALEAILASA